MAGLKVCLIFFKKPTESVEGHQVGAVAGRSAEQPLCRNGMRFAIIVDSLKS